MKIAFLHLSDFHVKRGKTFIKDKIDKLVNSLNVLGEIDKVVLLFSGDLASKGDEKEYQDARFLIKLIINTIKRKYGNSFCLYLVVPGNHDLSLPSNARNGKEIQAHYDTGTITDLINDEKEYLSNFNNSYNSKGLFNKDFFVYNYFYDFDDYKIQFNLINTAPFSTLDPDDKELHYFPEDKIYRIKRKDDTSLCITVMHHNWEWFNWECKEKLENAILDNCEFILYGHDHRKKTVKLSAHNDMYTWISAAGEMDFSKVDIDESFNAFVVDTITNTFDGFTFTWDKNQLMYCHELVADKAKVPYHSNNLLPKPSFLKLIKEDNYNISEDFTKYFVFPKLVSTQKNEFGDFNTITSVSDFIDIISEKKRIVITGSANSGKTTLLKYLYLSYINDKIPLFLSADEKPSIKTKSFIKHLFEEQYSDEPVLFKKYEQMDIDRKVLIVDDWDSLKISKKLGSLFDEIKNSFGYVIVSTANGKPDIIDNVKDELDNSSNYYELGIKPFYTEKRNELVKSVCSGINVFNDHNINNLNKIIDSLVSNNSGIFSLNPAFIVRYTKYIIDNPYLDYTKGEAVFSKIFEFELNKAIIDSLRSKQDAEETFTVFEEIAGYMFKNRKDLLSTEDINSIVNEYNSNYGESVKTKSIIEVGLKSKVFRQTDDMRIYFSNKNHLSYFIAKYLIRVAQESDSVGIEYALENICFGINSEIIMFISYLLSDSKIINLIIGNAETVFNNVEELSFSKENISLLHKQKVSKIAAPSSGDQKRLQKQKEKNEERIYSEEIIEAKNLFDYEEESIEDFNNKLIRAIKYTELISKSLPAFHSTLKLTQKREIIEKIYLYPRKIVYYLLNPIDSDIELTCQEIMDYIKEKGIKKKNGKEYSEDDIMELLSRSGLLLMLGLFDHFAELAVSPKSYDLLLEKDLNDLSEFMIKLLVIDNSGDTDRLLQEAETGIKEYKNTEYEIMIKYIVKKHLLTNRDISYNKRQQIIDKIFGKGYRKEFLIDSQKLLH